MTQNNYDRYLSTYAGENLTSKHSLDQEGIWKILGEDPNCDMGGTHYQPELDIVTGKLKDVIEYAVELPRFWQWGGGGNIILLNKPKVINPSTNEKRKLLQKEVNDLESKLEKLKKDLSEL